ncbi:hypothetical protein AOX55_00005293 (plasmid) [Sinorhizobium fredii CCBAU 25509]|nr:hypothetical protein AOX55_00005293 [Sinorhizobium fredii CCBAU 25509]
MLDVERYWHAVLSPGFCGKMLCRQSRVNAALEQVNNSFLKLASN